MAKYRTSKKISMDYSATIMDIVSLNSMFDKGKLRIAYVDENRNGSSISKEVFEKCLPSLSGVPVVAHYRISNNTIGSHDTIVENKKEYVLTTPIGYVPQNFKWEWEDVEEKTGDKHTYLVTECILWSRENAYERIKELGTVSQSMEIAVDEYTETDDGIIQIENFEFRALCLLDKDENGKDVEPCFESACLEYNLDTQAFMMKCLESKLNEMYSDYKLAFGYNPIDNYKNRKEHNNMDKLHELLSKYNIDESLITFSVEGLSDEEIENTFNTEFGLTSEFRNSLCDALGAEKIDTEYGTYNRYCFVDYDFTTKEVYAYDRKDWKLYGFTYSQSGDNVIIDFACKTKKKYAIVDYVDGDMEFSLEELVTPVLENYELKGKSEASTDYEAKIQELSVSKDEFDKYKQYHDTTEFNKLHKEKLNIVSKEAYVKLAEIDTFKDLLLNIDNFSKEEIETKADAILGKYNRENKSTEEFDLKDKSQSKSVQLKNLNSENDDKHPVYGGLFI